MKTSSGFEYKIEESRLKNYELVEALADLESNPLSLPKVLRLLLGDQVESLKNHLRASDGTVSMEALMEEVKEIFESGQLKK
ncbi:hypothetical protein V2H07_01080 [Streptococcus agalactiae]|uniref:hypothetical protein n=1 Tax=Streptococcus agalactiae TaxID=1311 RepID=UPI002ECBB018|nr:hypothetical protein [Streptococcus agalactiae]MEE3765762.1 hypothetical protein [Streptococcus agalactiae]